ncbi:MAG: DMT family transporter [Nocardioidaceae bacterium]|nr:DMT family transporter [Nocardioidaceae bacterium]
MNALLALVGVLGVSASGPLMAGTQAPALAIAFWRNALAVGGLAPVAATTRRHELGALTAADVRLCAFSGVMLACHFATWVSALKLTSVAAATALVCTQVGWVALVERVTGGTPVQRGVLVGLGVSFLGVLLISGVDLQLSARALTGDLLALAGGLFAAVYTISGGRARRRLSTTVYTLLCYGVCAVLLLVAALVAGDELVTFGASTWAGILAVTVCAQLLGHSVFNHLLAVMSPQVVSLVLLLEVPGAALLAAAFLGQAPPAGVWAGLVLILAGLVVVISRRPPEADDVAVDTA